MKGLAPYCTYWAIKFGDDSGYTRDELIVAALRYAWKNAKCTIISNPWSYGPAGYSALLEAELDTMYRSGIVVFFASGNDRKMVDWPSKLPTVTAVGSTERSDEVTWWSGKGPELDVVAPGADIWTWDVVGVGGYVPLLSPECPNWNYMCAFGGTSAATPIAAGVAALVLSRRSVSEADRVETVRAVLENTAEDKGSPGFDNSYGYGRVNAYYALLSVIHGDVNNDGLINLEDVELLINIVHYGGQAVLDNVVADVNCDGHVDDEDIVNLISCVHFGWKPPICYERPWGLGALKMK